MNETPKSLIPNIEMVISSVSLFCMAGITITQVFNRYILGSSLPWSEELARYLFIWSVFVGCSYATQLDRHLEVTIIRNLFKKLARPITIIVNILTIIFCLFATFIGIKLIILLMDTGQRTPALEISAVWVYLSMPLGLGFMTFRTAERLWWLLTGKIDAGNVTIE